MKPHETEFVPNSGTRSAKAIIRERGISATTLWRWRRNGWLKTVNICGKVYIDLQSLADFDLRAAAGDFAKAAGGAAGASQKIKKKQGQQT